MNEVILSLLYRQVRGEVLDESAQQILDEWVNQSPENKALYDEVVNNEDFKKDIQKMLGYDSIAAWNKIKKGLPKSDQPKVIPFYRRYAAAIVFLLLVGSAGVYFGFFKKSSHNSIARENKIIQPSEVKPATEGAILRLADGRLIDLDDIADGQVIAEGNVSIIKKNGKLQYAVSGQGPATAGMNTMRAPRKKHYRVDLVDGTIAYLNSGSSIQYPPVFTGKERRVIIEGEVYFEVAKNANMPFKVDIHAGGSKKGEVTVLGTHFNINAYDDEPSIQTTLLEGSVRIAYGDEIHTLKPGQQARLTTAGVVQVGVADKDRVMAWRGNDFYFDDDNIVTIMRQVSRWYDVQVVYEGLVNPTKKYTTTFSRNQPIDAVFEALESYGGVHFEIIEQDDTTKVIVKP